MAEGIFCLIRHAPLPSPFDRQATFEGKAEYFASWIQQTSILSVP